MKPIIAAIVLSFAGIHSPMASAPLPETLLVGKTNILCTQLPCPWRGIRPADRTVSSPSDLLWREQTLPELEASGADASRLRAAWSGDECLVVEGGLVGPTLRVDRIVGACPQ